MKNQKMWYNANSNTDDYDFAEYAMLFFFLLDQIKIFIVCDTNYYSLNKLPAPEVGMAQKVGDLLHCRNAAEAGECGMHQQCKLCGIRAGNWRAFFIRKRVSKK